MSAKPRVALCALFALLPDAAFAASACPELPEYPDLACEANAHGWFYARDSATATAMAEDAAVTALGFERHFGRTAPIGAVVDTGTLGGLGDDSVARLRQAGATWEKTWVNAQSAAIGMMMRQKHPDADDAGIAVLVEEAIAAIPASERIDERNVMRHEIGHSLLVAAFWPRSGSAARQQPSDGAQYGGPGPDWLDEAAAMLVETGTEKAIARRELASAHAKGALWPLPEFLDMSHPALRQSGLMQAQAGMRMQAGPAPGGDGSRDTSPSPGAWQVFSMDEGTENETTSFYAQAQGVAEFLIETSGNPQVLGGLATHLADGGDMAGWLAAQGPSQGLAGTIPALERDWLAWLAQRD